MARRESILADYKQPLVEQDRRSSLLHENIVRHTAQLETAEPDSQQARDAASKLDGDMRQCVALLQAFAAMVTQINERLQPLSGENDD